MNIFVSLFISLLFFAQKKERIYREKQRKLAVSDFTVQETNSPNFPVYSAFTFSNVYISYHFCKKHELCFIVRAYFAKDSSFITADATNDTYGNTQLLKHEQGHFDIAEISARKIRRYLLNSTFDDTAKVNNYINYQISIQLIYMDYTNDVYDNETLHGIDTVNQKKWSASIQEQLDSLKKYENPEGIVILK